MASRTPSVILCLLVIGYGLSGELTRNLSARRRRRPRLFTTIIQQLTCFLENTGQKLLLECGDSPDGNIYKVIVSVAAMHDDYSIMSRMFPALAAASVVGHQSAPIVDLGGTRQQVMATARVMAATSDLNDMLASKNQGLENVMKSVDRKNAAAAEFLQHVGSPWPL